MAKGNCFIVLPCAGAGKRMGGGSLKFLLDLGGISVLGLTLKHLHDCEEVKQIVLVLPENILDSFVEKELPKLTHDKISCVVAGGSERQISIWHGLRTLKGDEGDFRVVLPKNAPKALLADENDLVAVHDAVRPFATPKLFTEVFDGAAKFGAAIAAIPIQDTVKKAENTQIRETLDRRELFLAQTPQAFRFGLLYPAYRQAIRQDFLGTDDSSLLEARGEVVRIVAGEKLNIKITTPEDLVMAQALWQQEKQTRR